MFGCNFNPHFQSYSLFHGYYFWVLVLFKFWIINIVTLTMQATTAGVSKKVLMPVMHKPKAQWAFHVDPSALFVCQKINVLRLILVHQRFKLNYVNQTGLNLYHFTTHDTCIRPYIQIELKHSFSRKVHDKASKFHYMKYNFITV